MNQRRALTALLGAWIAGIVAIIATAISAYHTHNLSLEAPIAEANKLLNEIGPEDIPSVAGLMRHQAASLLKLQFQMAEMIQILLGISVIMLYAISGRVKRNRLMLLGILLVLTVGEFVALRPFLERAMHRWEFAIPGEIFEKRDAMLYAGIPYLLCELVKMGILGYLIYQTVTSLTVGESGDKARRRSSRERQKAEDEEVRSMLPFR
jgi:hypothetical protein